MQEYPMRERIYLAVTKFGVPHTDWKWVLIAHRILLHDLPSSFRR